MKLLIFDFDGTIADTKKVYYEEIYGSVKSFGIKRKDLDGVIKKGLNLRKTLRKFGLGFLERAIVRRKVQKRVMKHLKSVKRCYNVSKIKDLDCQKIVVSNSLKEFIFPVIKRLRLKNYFSEVYGAEDFDDKGEFISEYLERRQISGRDVIYIGDRVADIEVARKAGCYSLIVSGRCAWDSRKDVVQAKPDFIIYDFSSLKEVLRDL